MNDEMEDLDWKRIKEEERRQIETFRRIRRLYKRGLRPDWDADVEDAIWWRHPGRYPDRVILYCDGHLLAEGGLFFNPIEKKIEKRDDDRIYNNNTTDEAAFDLWLASIKPPTWWQSGREARDRYIVGPIIYAGILGFGFLIALIGRQIWRWLSAALLTHTG